VKLNQKVFPRFMLLPCYVTSPAFFYVLTALHCVKTYFLVNNFLRSLSLFSLETNILPGNLFLHFHCLFLFIVSFRNTVSPTISILPFNYNLFSRIIFGYYVHVSVQASALYEVVIFNADHLMIFYSHDKRIEKYNYCMDNYDVLYPLCVCKVLKLFCCKYYYKRTI